MLMKACKEGYTAAERVLVSDVGPPMVYERFADMKLAYAEENRIWLQARPSQHFGIIGRLSSAILEVFYNLIAPRPSGPPHDGGLKAAGATDDSKRVALVIMPE
jgi:hypothetical protein